MARTALTVIALTGPYPADAEFDTVTFTAGDSVNNNSFLFTGREIILVRNDNVSPQMITAVSVADDLQRTGDVTLDVPASTYCAFEATKIQGWLQTDGYFYLNPESSDIKIAVLRLSR